MEQIEFWHWLIAGVVMIILEMLLPAAYFLWMGMSALVVGAILFMAPTIPLMIQVLVFGICSIVSVILFKRYQKSNPRIKDQPNLNRRGHQYVGRVFTLDEAIVNGVGKVKVDDSTWKVKGIDLPVGTNVRVISVEGTVLYIEPETGIAGVSKG